MNLTQTEKWRSEIISYVEDIEDPYWLRYILQTVHMIWGSMEEIYPEIEDEEDDDYYG